MPFNDGSGVLVISHTNAAVNEIKEKICKYCPRLFSYPNFIGTIQSFVDEFLAIPFYTNKHNKRPIRIDDEIYCQHHYVPQQARGWLNKQHDKEIFPKSRLLGENDLIYGLAGKAFPLKNKSSSTYKSILALKQQIKQKGYLCFDDAYILASEYLQQNPKVKTILQKRFKYVFVDEMQDMAHHQHDILEKIFFDGGNSVSSLQRIGDKNQAIFDGDIRLEDIWNSRDTVLELRGSYRLHPKIANVVKYFALNPMDVEGRRKNDDGSNIDIKPHIIVFNDDSIHRVIYKFSEIIRDLQSANKIPTNPNLDKPEPKRSMKWF